MVEHFEPPRGPGFSPQHHFTCVLLDVWAGSDRNLGKTLELRELREFREDRQADCTLTLLPQPRVLLDMCPSPSAAFLPVCCYWLGGVNGQVRRSLPQN